TSANKPAGQDPEAQPTPRTAHTTALSGRKSQSFFDNLIAGSHFGGTRQGLAISWPGHINDPGGIRNQFHHVIDIVPTILEATGIKAPEVVDGIKQKPIEGVSMAYTFDKANANAPSTRKTQYFEMIANRGIYKDGWYANT